MNYFFILAVLLVTLTACSSDNTEPPAELHQFEETHSIQKIWQREIGAGTTYRPLKFVHKISDGVVYVANADGEVGAYDAHSGDRVWRVNLERRLISGIEVSDDYVFVGGDDGEVIALRKHSGELIWEKILTSEALGFGQSKQGVLVVRTGDGKLHALSMDSGSVLWQAGRPVPALSLRGVSNPIVVGAVVISAFDNGVVTAFSLDRGNVLWETRVAQSKGRSEIERLVDLDGKIVLDRDVLFIAGYQGNVTAITVKEGRVLWSQALSSYAGLSADEDYLYVVDEADAIYALSKQNGRTLWAQKDLRLRRITVPAVLNDQLVVGDYEGYLHVINKENGKFLTRTRIDEYPILAAPVITKNAFLSMSSTGEMALLSVR